MIGNLGCPKPYDSVRNQKQKCVTLAQKKFPYMLRSYISKYSLLSFQSLTQKSSNLGFWCLLNGRFLNSFEIVKIFNFMELNYCTLCKPPWKTGESHIYSLISFNSRVSFALLVSWFSIWVNANLNPVRSTVYPKLYINYKHSLS